ncbi:MAG: Imm52 family immunity protein [Rhodobacteraceae bacterium]|jgi:hypothetical protein|nr:Imm52 family immunity protein [Paracoccaceae bacterium]
MRRPRTREEARQQALEQLRSRPRSADDESLYAWFAHRPETLAEGVRQFVMLAKRLIGTNRYVEYWDHARNASEQDAGSGLDIVAEPDEFIRFWRSRGKGDDRFSIGTTGFSESVPIAGTKYYTAGLNYSGGLHPERNNTLGFFGRSYTEPRDHTLTLDEWRAVVAVIVDWRVPLHIGIGSRNYPIHDAVFDHRAWAGWMGWFPVRIDPVALPDFALTFPIGPGTLVAAQETNVITTDPAQVARAQEVEIALVELGVLPTQEDLIGLRLP